MIYGALNVDAAPNDILTLKQAEQLVLSANPALAAQSAHARGLAERPPQVGTLPDPHVSFTAVNLPVDTFSATQENMTQLKVGLSQTIPFPGKLRLKSEAATLVAEAAVFDTDELRLKLVRNVKIRWWNLFYLDRALEIVHRNETLIQQFIQIAQTKYKVGKGLQQDVLLAQVELSKLLNIGIQLTGARRDEVARLNALINRRTNTSIHLSGHVNETLIKADDEVSLQEMAMATRPKLAGQHRHIEASESRVKLAKKDYYPDFKIGGGYGFRSGINPANRQTRPDFLTMGISMNLPIFTSTKQDRALAERKAQVAKAQFSLQDAVEAVQAEVSRALADYIQARDQARLFKTGIIPQASQTVASMLAGYQVNKVDFLNLVRAQITLYNFETQYWKAIASARQAQARLSAAVGKETFNHE